MMPIVETITISLGAAIAKSILKIWLGDSTIAVDMSSSLVDLVRLKTNDVMARQRAKRQFEEIGESVAQSLIPIFEEADLNDEGRTAVALAVADRLDQTEITTELLAERDLDPRRLSDHLLAASHQVTIGFSAPENALFERILVESSAYIVDIASQLPAFSERTFSEVLKRQNALQSTAVQVLDEVRRIQESSQSANPDTIGARFETDYRRAVVRALDILNLFGANITGASRRHKLSVAYVTLQVAPITSSPPDYAPSGSDAAIMVESNEYEPDDAEILLADDLLNRSNRLVVRGFAGSGKTTLLQWVAVTSALQKFEESLAKRMRIQVAFR